MHTALTHPHRAPRLAVAAFAAWTTLSAQAVSTSNGQALYSAHCASCHGSSVTLDHITSGRNASVTRTAINRNTGGMGTASLLALTDAELNDIAAYIVSVRGGTATYIATSSGPAVSLSSSSVAFGSVTVGNSSSHSITLSNTGDSSLSLSSLSVDNAVFTLSHSCGSTLAASASCTLTLGFTPSTTGSTSGTLSIMSDASTSPDSLTLSGTGVAASSGSLAWTDSDSALSFTSTVVGATAGAQTVTLRNSGGSSATLSALTLDGSNADQFSLSGSCAAGAVLAAGGSCSVVVDFAPTSTGSKTASLQVSSSDATTPSALSLSGTATAASSDSSTDTTTTTASSNAGGGCSLSDGSEGTDPVLWGLVLAAAGVLVWRRR